MKRLKAKRPRGVVGVESSCAMKTETAADGAITLRLLFVMALDNMLPGQAALVKENPGNLKRALVDEVARLLQSTPFQI